MWIRGDRRRLIKEGVIVAAGQVIAAIGTLIGIRLLTEVAFPSLFGEFSLAMGALALVQGLAYQPLGHAVLRYYSEWVDKEGSEAGLRQFMAKTYASRLVGFLPGLVGVSALLLSCTKTSALTVVFFLLLLALEGWKVLEIVLANASRKQSEYAVLVASEAVLRPVGSASVALASGASLEALVAGQCLALSMILGAYYVLGAKPKSFSRSGTVEIQVGGEMKRFAGPLLWLPLIGWISGVADRYIVGGVLGLPAAGIYAAAYGLASRPFLFLGSITEATLRQPMYVAFSEKRSQSGRRLLASWVFINLGIGSVGAVLIWWLRDLLVGLLLAPPYRAAADLLTWIAGGYVLLLVAQALERRIYVAGNTRTVVRIQFVSASVGLILAFVAARVIGVKGVAAVVPIYFALQVAMTLFAVRRSAIQDGHCVVGALARE